MLELISTLRGFDLFYTAGVVAAFILGYTIRGIIERVRLAKQTYLEQESEQNVDSSVR
jgi:hypothetical protein